MGYVKDMFMRMDLQQIRAFLLYGAEDFIEKPQTYEERLKIGSNPIYNRLYELYPNEDEQNIATADLAQALTVYEAVYLEIGMKAGARLLCQLLHTDDETSVETAQENK